MKNRFVILLLFAGLILSAGLFSSWRTANSQNSQKRLTLSYIKKELISTELSETEKNKILIITVKKFGVDFDLASDDEQVLRAIGANDELIAAIKENGLKSIPTPTPVSIPTPTVKPTPTPTVSETPISTPTPSETPVSIEKPTQTPTPTPARKELTKELILTGLTNKDYSISQRNKTLINGVIELGVNFELTEEIKQELKANGATPKLIETIRSNGPTKVLKTSGKVVTNSIGMELVSIPAGSFKMGTDSLAKIKDKNGKVITNNDQQRGYEDPAHTVTLKEGFLMGKYEVTQEQWQKVMGTTIRDLRDKTKPFGTFLNKNKDNELYGEGPNFPIYYVTWNDAKKFIEKLNSTDTQYVYSLPSEAQWEYACRAGSKEEYVRRLDDMAWYVNNSGIKKIDADTEYEKLADVEGFYQKFLDNVITPNKIEGTHLVGQKNANDFGLYDMNGNVWEWCEDIFKESYEGAKTDGTADLEPTRLNERVIRGGSWYDGYPFLEYLRFSFRFRSLPTAQLRNVGFRVVAHPKVNQ